MKIFEQNWNVYLKLYLEIFNVFSSLWNFQIRNTESEGNEDASYFGKKVEVWFQKASRRDVSLMSKSRYKDSRSHFFLTNIFLQSIKNNTLPLRVMHRVSWFKVQCIKFADNDMLIAFWTLTLFFCYNGYYTMIKQTESLIVI